MTTPSAARLLALLSLEAKVALLTGTDSWTLPGNDDLGLRPVTVRADG